MSKGLEALKRVRLVYESTDMPIIEKELKALEIIKKYILDDLDYLDLLARNQGIPKEENDLLKEVLK